MSFATACAPSISSQPVASSLQVDPLGEVIAIPPGSCLGLDDHFAMSTNAVRALLMNEREKETQHALAMNDCQSAARVALAQRDSAARALESAGWWQRWGTPLVAAGIVLGAAFGVVTGFEVGRK